MTDWSINKCTCCDQSYWVVFERNYFAKGACRWAFRGTYYGQGEHEGRKCVTKVFQVSNFRLGGMLFAHKYVAATKVCVMENEML